MSVSTDRGVSRRQFVRGAAGAAALPLILPATGAAEKKADNAGPSDRLNVGFIGTGKMCQGHIGFMLGQPDVQVVAVCDVDTTRREHAKKTVETKYADKTKSGSYKGCAAYVDFRELLGRGDIDAVVIATPDHWHCIPAVEACKAKKDIYCEKPLSLTIREAKLMIDAARKYDRVFQTGSQQRSDPEFKLAHELIRSGKIGKVKKVTVDVAGPSRPCDLPEEPMEPGLNWDLWLGAAPKRPYNSVLSPRGVHNHFPNWRSYREYSGGMMTDWGAHHFDIAQWCLGMDESGPVEVIPPDDPKAQSGVKYIYADGVEMIHGKHGPVGGVLFEGTDGTITVTRGKIVSTPEEIAKATMPGRVAHQRNWLDCVRSRKKPVCDVEIGARSVTVCHLGNLAYWNHKKLKWDPQHWQFVNDAEADKWLDRKRRDPWQLPTV